MCLLHGCEAFGEPPEATGPRLADALELGAHPAPADRGEADADAFLSHALDPSVR
jgi:hypothetical protein